MRACSKKTFGAFHEGTWAGSGDFCGGVCGGVWDQNTKANFLFKLGDSLEKFPNKGSGNYALKNPNFWPAFGYGWDLCWGYGGKVGAGTGAECIAKSYSGHATNEICGSDGNWGTTHLEVWRLA